MADYFRLKTFHDTTFFINGKLHLTHKYVGFGDELPLLAEQVDNGICFFVVKDGKTEYVTKINADTTVEFAELPTPFNINIVDADRGSFALKYDDKYLSARKTTGLFSFVPRNLAWELFTLSPIESCEKKDAVLLMLNNKNLDFVLSTLNLDRIRLMAIVMDGAGDEFTTINGEKVRFLSSSLIEKLFVNREIVDKEKVLWLIGGRWPSADFNDIWKAAKFLMDENVPRSNILNAVIFDLVERRWVAALHYVNNNAVDYFTTGISYTEEAFNATKIEGAHGVNLASASQDIYQGYLVAQHVFNRQPPPIMIFP